MSIDTIKYLHLQKRLSDTLSEEIDRESTRLNVDYLDHALSIATKDCLRIAEVISVMQPDLLPPGASKRLAIGKNQSMITASRHFYIFAFPDGSWFSHNRDSLTLTYAGTRFMWDQFLAKHFNLVEA